MIEELDGKKKVAMEDTWHKVNAFFGSIFTTLLPGTQVRAGGRAGGQAGLRVHPSLLNTGVYKVVEHVRPSVPPAVP